MTFYLFKTILKRAVSITMLLLSAFFWTQPVLASDAESKAIAMQIAEKQTQGKAVRAQYKETANRSGFSVRLIKEGKVIHQFIPLKRIKRN